MTGKAEFRLYTLWGRTTSVFFSLLLIVVAADFSRLGQQNFECSRGQRRSKQVYGAATMFLPGGATVFRGRPGGRLAGRRWSRRDGEGEVMSFVAEASRRFVIFIISLYGWIYRDVQSHACMCICVHICM